MFTTVMICLSVVYILCFLKQKKLQTLALFLQALANEIY